MVTEPIINELLQDVFSVCERLKSRLNRWMSIVRQGNDYIRVHSPIIGWHIPIPTATRIGQSPTPKSAVPSAELLQSTMVMSYCIQQYIATRGFGFRSKETRESLDLVLLAT